MKFRVLLALLIILFTCCPHLMSDVNVTPRYLADVTYSRM